MSPAKRKSVPDQRARMECFYNEANRGITIGWGRDKKKPGQPYQSEFARLAWAAWQASVKAHDAQQFEERMALLDTLEELDYSKTPVYLCGCGGNTWILVRGGNCVCEACNSTQIRLVTRELAPVGERR